MTVCNFLFDYAYMVCGLTKFKMFNMHTDRAARNYIHCVHIFPDILKNNDASQRVNVGPDVRRMVQPGCEHRPIELYLRTNSDIKNDKINSIIIVQRVLGKSYSI